MQQNKIAKEKLEKFIQDNSWAKQMSGSRGLDSFDNYIGSCPEHDLVVVGRNRDSNLLSESNFHSALELLGGESKHVTVERFGHWGCGWFELILVNPKHIKSVITAYEIKKSLEEYPILDDTDYYERENAALEQTVEDNIEDFTKLFAELLGCQIEDFSEDDLKDLNTICHGVIRCDVSYSGYEYAYITEDSIKRFFTSGESLYIPESEISITLNQYFQEGE